MTPRLEEFVGFRQSVTRQGGIISRLVRTMYVCNPIPSQIGVWSDTDQSWIKMPLDRVVEDPFFKDSAQSHCVQLADLRAQGGRERPIPSKTRCGLDAAFNILDPILLREARGGDPEGNIRPFGSPPYGGPWPSGTYARHCRRVRTYIHSAT